MRMLAIIAAFLRQRINHFQSDGRPEGGIALGLRS
jgi:hypothetical protein